MGPYAVALCGPYAEPYARPYASLCGLSAATCPFGLQAGPRLMRSRRGPYAESARKPYAKTLCA